MGQHVLFEPQLTADDVARVVAELLEQATPAKDGDPKERALNRVEAAHRLRGLLTAAVESMLDEQLVTARAAEVPWSALGRVLGMSGQAVGQRLRGRRAAPPGPAIPEQVPPPTRSGDTTPSAPVRTVWFVLGMGDNTEAHLLVEGRRASRESRCGIRSRTWRRSAPQTQHCQRCQRLGADADDQGQSR